MIIIPSYLQTLTNSKIFLPVYYTIYIIKLNIKKNLNTRALSVKVT